MANMRGPMRGGGRAGISDLKNVNKKTVSRLFSYIGRYKLRLIAVLFCIIISAVANVQSSLF